MSVAKAIHDELATWPEVAEMDEILNVLSSMDEGLLIQLRYMVLDTQEFTRPGERMMGPGVRIENRAMKTLMTGRLRREGTGLETRNTDRQGAKIWTNFYRPKATPQKVRPPRYSRFGSG